MSAAKSKWAKRIIRGAWLAAFVVFALGFLFNFLRNNAGAVLRMEPASARFFVVALGTQVLYFVLIVVCWQSVLKSASRRAPGFWDGLGHILLVNFGKYIPGKVWGLAARAGRLKESGFSSMEIVKASYLEQFMLLGTGLWLGFLAAFVAFEEPMHLAPVLILTVALVFVGYGHRLVDMLLAFAPGLRSLSKYFEISVPAVRAVAIAVGYVGIWLLLTMTFVFVAKAILPLDLSVATVAVFLLSVTAGYLAGFAAVFAPGGAGVREGVGATFLSSVVPLESAVFLMLAFRLWTVLSELLAGSLFGIWTVRRARYPGERIDDGA